MEGTVIIVDDHQQFADMLALQLGAAGMAVQAHYHAAPLLQSQPGPEDIVILDLLMPDMDGVELLRALKEQGCRSGLILVSGQDQGVLRAAEDLATAQNLNYLTSFSKPFKLAEITQFLREHERGERPNQAHAKQWQPDAQSLKLAIQSDQLLLHFQPQLDIQRNRLVGFEALVRWQHPDHGLVSPGAFIPLAEETRLIGPLTEWVIQQTINQLLIWKRQGLETKVSVNVSADNISQFDLPQKVAELLESYELRPQQLVLEVTETALMTELIPSLDVLTRMRMKGFQLSIDDFGTGYSSLYQLHKIPFTELKIDRGFVKEMGRDPDSLAIVETCIMLGHKLNMQVVAEGIEDQACLDTLIELGCDIGQGFLMAHPMPSAEIAQWLERNPEYH